MKPIVFSIISVLVFACSAPQKIAGRRAKNPLEKVLAAHAADLDSVLSRPEVYEVQIIYTQVVRDENQRPHFTTFSWNADSTCYFYPASMVKLPLALLSLEKINNLRKSGYPRLSKDTPYRLDSLRPFQQKVVNRKGAPGEKPSIAQDIREIFVVSDNEAYNHLFEFLGREYINRTLHEKGYTRTNLMHRFNYSGRENQFSSPMTFYQNGRDLLHFPETEDKTVYKNPQTGTTKGRGYLNSRDSLVNQPFDFSRKNWFSLHDMERMLRAVIFPEAMPEQNRFDLTAEDYNFVLRHMGLFPRECDFPKYDEKEYWDGYVKFFLFGDTKARQSGEVRLFNKVGEAYGTLTDVAYVVDFQNNVEFVLAATILCNRDGIFNDDKYDYDSVGFPFLAKLGQAVYEYELKRPRKVRPDLSKFKRSLN